MSLHNIIIILLFSSAATILIYYHLKYKKFKDISSYLINNDLIAIATINMQMKIINTNKKFIDLFKINNKELNKLSANEFTILNQNNEKFNLTELITTDTKHIFDHNISIQYKDTKINANICTLSSTTNNKNLIFVLIKEISEDHNYILKLQKQVSEKEIQLELSNKYLIEEIRKNKIAQKNITSLNNFLQNQNALLIRKEQNLNNHIKQLEKSYKEIENLKTQYLDRAYFLQQILDAIPMPLIVCDLNKKISFFNNAFAQTFSISLNEYKGKSCDSINIPICKQKCSLKLLNNNQNSNFMSFNNKHFNISSLFIKNLNNQNTAFIEIFQDVTELYKKNIKTQKSLKKEQEINALKTYLVNTISHEFRNPLAVINSAVQLFKELDSSISKQQKEQLFNKIFNSIEYITSILNDINLINKEESVSKLNFKPENVNIHNLINNTINNIKNINPNTEITYSIQKNINNVYIDEKLITIILNNIINNSIKFSSNKKPVINITITTDNNYLLFSIIDNGIGIPQHEIKKIFEPFYRASNSKNINGTGLGLSIVKNCVEIHKGKIKINSKPGDGTKTYIYIPYNNNQLS